MAISNIRDFFAKSKDTPLTLNAKIKEYEPGTQVSLVNVIPVQGKDMAMVAVPGGRPFAAPPESLDVVGAAPAAAAEDETSIEGPVLDFFASHANLDSELGLNFATNYIATFGTEDVSFISGLVEAAGMPIGQGWTAEQTADFAIQFYETFGLDVDPLAVKALEEAKAAAAKVAASAPATTAAPAKGKGKGSKAAAPSETARVDKSDWDATRMDALKIAGLLLPVYSESPDTFNDALTLAVKMLNAAQAVK